jgi:hypothetical protein
MCAQDCPLRSGAERCATNGHFYVAIEHEKSTAVQAFVHYIARASSDKSSPLLPNHTRHVRLELWKDPSTCVMRSIEADVQLRRSEAAVHAVLAPGHHLRTVVPGTYIMTFSAGPQRPIIKTGNVVRISSDKPTVPVTFAWWRGGVDG